MYGLPVGGMSYDDYLGLYLNVPRVRARKQADVAAGTSLASVADPRDVPDLEWFESLTDDPTEARLWWQKSLQRAQAAKAQSG